MKIITLETLKTMPNGTVFSQIDVWGNFENGIRILTGRFEDKEGFNGEMELCPSLELNEYVEMKKDREYPTEWVTCDGSHVDYEESQLFAVFSKQEIEKMIKALQWALTDLKGDFDMNEILI